MALIVPPKEVFEIPPEAPNERLSGYHLSNFQKVIRSTGGEMLAFYEGHPVPRKGLPYIEAILSTNHIKRLTLLLLSPLSAITKGPTAFIESFLDNYCRMCDSIYLACERVPYLKKEFYNSTSKAVWDLISTFLQEIGITKDTAEHTGKIAATILENDDAYRMPIVDIMTEFSKEEILKSPTKAIEKVAKILQERSDNEYMKDRFHRFIFIAKIALWIPRFRKAFKKAFEQVDLKLLQYDQYDYYWSLNRKGYNAHGRSIDDRMAEMRAYINKSKEHAIQQREQ